MNLIKQFSAPDNKVLAAIANVMLYIAGPLGTFAIMLARILKKIDADTATELTTAWVSLIGAFKLITKFSTVKKEDNDSNNNNNAS